MLLLLLIIIYAIKIMIKTSTVCYY